MRSIRHVLRERIGLNYSNRIGGGAYWACSRVGEGRDADAVGLAAALGIVLAASAIRAFTEAYLVPAHAAIAVALRFVEWNFSIVGSDDWIP